MPRGSNGFGYDPYFWLPDLGVTAAQLTAADEKNAQSSRQGHARPARPAHRARAAPVSGAAAELAGSALALYVHMPWCVRKCPYCDFNSHQLKSAAPDASYIDALIRDFDLELPPHRSSPDRHRILRRRHAESVFARGIQPSARRAAAANRVCRGCGNHPGSESRDHRTRPFRRLSRCGHQSRVVGRAELCSACAQILGAHPLGRRHAPRGRGIARRQAR